MACIGIVHNMSLLTYLVLFFFGQNRWSGYLTNILELQNKSELFALILCVSFVFENLNEMQFEMLYHW